MKKYLIRSASIVVFCASLTAAHSQSYISNLDGAQDGGGLRQGTGSVTLTLVNTTLSLSGSYSGLTSPSTAGHIHGPSGPFPATATVRYPLDALGLISLGATSGTFSGSLNLADIGAYTVAQQISDLNAGLWYLNIHNSSFPGGEIRGAITLVPEPTALAILGIGAAGMLLRSRTRRP